jgi:hypothetical protein
MPTKEWRRHAMNMPFVHLGARGEVMMMGRKKVL